MKANSIASMYRTVFSVLAGLTFSGKEIAALITAQFPDVNVASLNIPDHAASAKQAQQYALHCFEKTGTGYRVLPVDKWVEKPSTKGSIAELQSKQTPAPSATVASAPAKTAGNNVLPQVVAQQTAKPNGEAKPATK